VPGQPVSCQVIWCGSSVHALGQVPVPNGPDSILDRVVRKVNDVNCVIKQIPKSKSLKFKTFIHRKYNFAA